MILYRFQWLEIFQLVAFFFYYQFIDVWFAREDILWILDILWRSLFLKKTYRYSFLFEMHQHSSACLLIWLCLFFIIIVSFPLFHFIFFKIVIQVCFVFLLLLLIIWFGLFSSWPKLALLPERHYTPGISRPNSTRCWENVNDTSIRPAQLFKRESM